MKLIRCNRCGVEESLSEDRGVNLLFRAISHANKWSKVQVVRSTITDSVAGAVLSFDLCQDCQKVLLEQFLAGASVEAVTKPADQTPLPHDIMPDCQIIWNPGTRRLLCRHDDPELFDALVVDADEGSGDLENLTDLTHQMVKDVRDAGRGHGFPQRINIPAQIPRTSHRGKKGDQR